VARNAEQAKRLVDAAVPLDLAVIEQRLQSPGDRFDISGVELGHWLKTEKGAYVVLLCGQRPQNGLVDTWIRNKWIDECQLKTMRADQRHEHLEQVLAEKIPVNFDLDIQGEHGSILDDEWRQLARAIEPLDGEENATPSWRDLEQIFYRLFPKKFVQSVKILPVPSGAGGAGVALAEVTHLATDLVESLIVKYGHQRAVRTEDDKFQRYVAPLGPRGIALPRWSSRWRGLAAIAYSVVQSASRRPCPTLADYLRRPDCTSKDEVFLIEALFFDIFRPWYDAFCRSMAAKTAVDPDAPLISHWIENLWAHRTATQAMEKLDSLPDEMQELGMNFDDGGRVATRLGNQLVTVQDPVHFVRSHAFEATPKAGPLCLVHGDLHPRNIFVLGQGPCVIDFADVHAGHPFRDFATLEASIRFSVLYDFSQHQEQELWQVEQDLVGSFFSPDWTALRAHPATLEQAIRLTHEIRSRASWLSKRLPEWEAHYALSLMFCLLKIAGARRISGSEHDDHAKQRRKLAFLAAGGLLNRCEALFAGSSTSARSGTVARRPTDNL
jgi:hypothetical protein